MDTEKIIEKLELEWDVSIGALGQLREGNLDTCAFDRLLATLEQLETLSFNFINKRIVSLVWFIPIFIEWQKEFFLKRGGNIQVLDGYQQKIINSLYKILGVP